MGILPCLQAISPLFHILTQNLEYLKKTETQILFSIEMGYKSFDKKFAQMCLEPPKRVDHHHVIKNT